MPLRSSRDCGASATDAARTVALPVVEAAHKPHGKIRSSKNSKRRAIVLALVHVVIIAHILHWVWAGSTISPIEPSEAMEFSKQGIINAGLIFFALALLSTLILGRWFCGWGCHLVALQDLCGWMMKKCGIRPKPFRSRTLIYVPLLLGLYMFIWPAFYRLAVAPWVGTTDRLPPWGIEAHLMTDSFWATFPGWAVAVPFLLICGFATVYFLGQKGFCTYGCPYGGFFAPLDRYAPARIRVTDACEHCGHCTAVCTSNVRVHEEVRDFGMVVDPGCMKCLDCVSVCPNDALYFGFAPRSARAPGGAPAAEGARRPSVQTSKRPKMNDPGRPLRADGRRERADSDKRPAHRRYDMSLREDLAVAALFAAVFFAFRGEFARFPLLMAAGVAMVMTFVIWKAWQVFRQPNVRLHGWQFKLRGSLKPAGVALTALAAMLAGFVVQSGAVNAMAQAASFHDDRVNVPRHMVFWTEDEPDDRTRHHAEAAIKWYERAAATSLNGFGFANAWRSMIDLRLAWLHAVLGDVHESEAILRQVLARDGDSPREVVVAGLGSVLAAIPDRHDEAIAWYRAALVKRSFDGEAASPALLDEFIAWAVQVGRIDDATAIAHERLAEYPRDAHTMRWLALLNLEIGRIEEGIALLRGVLEIDPDNAQAREALNRAQ